MNKTTANTIKHAGYLSIAFIFFVIAVIIYGEIKEQKNTTAGLLQKIDSLSLKNREIKKSIDTLNIKLGYVKTINNITIIDQQQ